MHRTGIGRAVTLGRRDTGGMDNVGGMGDAGSEGAPSTGGAPSQGRCGDGTTNTGETCDDGNQVTEACPYGKTACVVCDATCQSVPGATSFCGDATRDSLQENCDDGNSSNLDTCSTTCKTCAALPVIAPQPALSRPLGGPTPAWRSRQPATRRWNLVSGTAYHLTNLVGENEYYASAPSGTFPVAASGGIRVDSGWCPAYPNNNPNFWIALTNLRSSFR